MNIGYAKCNIGYPKCKVIRNYFFYISFNGIHGLGTDFRFMRLLVIAENIPHSWHLVGLPDKILWRKKITGKCCGAGTRKGT